MRAAEPGTVRSAIQRLASLASVAAATAIVLFATGARANGRFPAASQLVVDPTDPKHLALRTTYGVVESVDEGKTWKWFCEKTVGYSGVLDPALGITSDGTLLAGVFDGLSVSHDRGCSFTSTKGVLDKQYVIDLSVEKNAPSHAVAVTSSGSGAGFFVVVAETLDDGKTFTQTGTAIPPDFASETIDVAPSDPKRIYVSGYFGSPHVAGVERSDDRGATWTRLTIPDSLAHGYVPYIAAIDPLDADRVYVRVNVDGPDVLLMSTDGAKTWSKLSLEAKGDLLGFALSPDGARIAAGGTLDGLQFASKSELVFTKKSAVAVRCLTWTSAGLYVCGSEYPDDFTVGFTTDEGATITPRYHLTDLSMLDCPAGSATTALCAPIWPIVEGTLGVDAGPSDGGSDAGGSAPRRDDAACGCTTPGGRTSTSSPPIAISISLSLVAAIARLCRRRRSTRN